LNEGVFPSIPSDIELVILEVMRLQTVIVLAVLTVACATQTIPRLSAADTFATHCASCHGPLGEGDGPVAGVIAVAVPNLRTLSQRNGGEFPADAVAAYIDGRNLPAAHGSRVMPVWGDYFDTAPTIVRGADGAEPRIEDLVTYLQELQYR
jgi:mono/diheme cytochrome c family protein